MRKTVLIVGFLFAIIFKGNSQCSYTGTPLTQVGSVNTFCVDNMTTITTGTVNAGQYVVVNVVKGFNYTFSVGNVFNGNRRENLTILNASTNGNVSPSVTDSSTSGASIIWTATLSGQIKLLLSHSSCTNDNRTGGALTLKLNSIGNTEDSQTDYGTDQWIGHVYNWTGNPAPGGNSPSSPTASYPFTNANYAGYYPITTETFTEGFGGDTNCISVYSDGAVRSTMYTEQFAVRYRMRSTKTGCYEAAFSGDDGVRIYVDGVKVFDEWREQSPTNYENVLLYLNGNSEIVFDYYENGGQNVANFSLTPFDSGSNIITAPTLTSVCSGVAPGVIDGSVYTYNGATVNPTISFQWQSSTNNVTFTNISGATSEDYTPAAITTTTGNIIRYYRRIVSAAAATASGCTYTSNAVTIVTSQGKAGVPGTISGTTTQCAALTGQTYSVTAVANATSYTWTLPTGWAITAGAGTNSITVTTGTSGQNGNISVASTNGCGSSAVRTLAVTVSPLSVAGTVSANQTICSGATPSNIILTGSTGTIQWLSSTDNVTFNAIAGATTTPLTGATIGVLAGITFYKAVVTNGSCASATSGTVTITATANAGTVSANQSICTNTQPANITLTGSTGAIQWQSSTNNITFNNISGATAATLTSAQMGTLTATRYYKAIITSGVCNAATSAAVTVTVNSASIVGTVSANQSICSGSSPANITLTGSIGSVQWQSSTNNIVFTNIVDATSTTLTSAQMGIVNGIVYYKAIVTNGGCSAATSATVTVALGATTSWNGNAWSNGTPTSASTVVFNADYTSSVDLNACTVTVTNNASVVIASGNNITINGALTVANGSHFTLKTNANLLQNTNVENSGAIAVERITPSLMRQDYVMWSSPVDGQQLQSFSPQTLATRFYTYSPSSNLYVAVSSPINTNFEIGNGYLIRVPNNHPATPATWLGTFTGKPHNGNLSIPVTNGGYNAIGNPYPSAINAGEFMAANGINEALYFWRKTNNTVTTSYATYTTAGGTSNSVSDPLGLVPNGIIQPCQGFIIKATTPSVSFANAMRVNNTNSPFFRLTENRSRIWLNLTSPEGFFGQTLVAYMPTATADIDPAIDGRFFNDSPTALTSIINNQEFIIQGRGPFDTSDMVSLGFKSQLGGTYTIAINNVDGLFDASNQAIYLKDNLMNTLTNLKTESYTFASEAGVFNSRFELVYENLLAVDQPAFSNNTVVVYHQQDALVIRSGNVKMDKVQLFDMRGRLVLEKNNINAMEVMLNLGNTNQVLIAKITSDQHETVIKKVVN